jgi:hypothetical protein
MPQAPKIRAAYLPYCLCAFSLLLPGCPDKDDTGQDACLSGSIRLADAHNYSLSGAIDVPSVVTAEGVDIEFCWDALDEDLQCHEVDPLADIDNVMLVRFASYSEEEIEGMLATNSLSASAGAGFVQDTQDGTQTCTRLSDMTMYGTSWNIGEKFVAGGGTFMLLLTTGVVPGVGARMLSFIEPTPGSDVTRVDVGSGCGMLDLEVDLGSLSPLALCDEGPWTVDWSDLTRDGQGNALADGKIDSLMIGFFEGRSVADLEAAFLDLELNATRIWTLPILGGHSVDLAEASDGAETFPGFSGEGVWILALRCGDCPNPAPLFLTRVEPRAE